MSYCKGPLARIGPNNLITNDLDLIRKILDSRSGYTRAPWFDSIRIDPHVPNIVSERDSKKHNRLRIKLSPGVKASSKHLLRAMLTVP